MREILFRGKQVGNGEWVYGDLIHRRILKKYVTVIRTEDSGFDNYFECDVIPETVGQYTGLTDDNGTKIFEGTLLNSAKTHFKSLLSQVHSYCLTVKGK